MLGWVQEGNGDSRSSEENRKDNGNHATQSPVATIFAVVKGAREFNMLISCLTAAVAYNFGYHARLFSLGLHGHGEELSLHFLAP
jgi:hypothetical protein